MSTRPSFRGLSVEKITIKSNRFGVEPELTAKLARLRARIYETPSLTAAATMPTATKITWRDGLAALWHTVRFRFFN